jgi:hypothetical protein
VNAADIVVQPYRDVLNSGSVLLSLSFYRPVLVPAKGSMTELKGFFGDSWVKCYDNTLNSDILTTAGVRAKKLTEEDRRLLTQKLGEINWDGIAEKTVEAYKTLIDLRRTNQRRISGTFQ